MIHYKKTTHFVRFSNNFFGFTENTIAQFIESQTWYFIFYTTRELKFIYVRFINGMFLDLDEVLYPLGVFFNNLLFFTKAVTQIGKINFRS